MNVEISGLAIRFVGADGDDTAVFHDFDLNIESGTVHAIVGPSGCGKSTLLRVISGLIQPSQGTVTLTGQRVAPNPVALVFQDPALIPWWTVGRNVGIGVEFNRERSGLYSKIRTFSLERVGLGGLANRLPGTLSRGQQTRAAIARAMAYDGDVMALDEPFVNIDAITKRRLWEEFETHWQLERRTYVFVTHDIEEAVLLADTVTVLSGSNPTRIVETIETGLPRPRGVERLTDPAYRSAIARVWDALESGAGEAR